MMIKVLEILENPWYQLYQIEFETFIHDDLKAEMMSTMCQPCEGETLPTWKCILGIVMNALNVIRFYVCIDLKDFDYIKISSKVVWPLIYVNRSLTTGILIAESF